MFIEGGNIISVFMMVGIVFNSCLIEVFMYKLVQGMFGPFNDLGVHQKSATN